ncbi:hypothetical protein L195_g055645 [Trifolium pratense]|uniref:Uncharacterized protein n=1 Tax=Trifolium pratense TaxID=57577 RepID=A0A2K3KMI4_TRIPR|nr:hypothetical protein L195_g055645 [Trifolium pratense]
MGRSQRNQNQGKGPPMLMSRMIGREEKNLTEVVQLKILAGKRSIQRIRGSINLGEEKLVTMTGTKEGVLRQ